MLKGRARLHPCACSVTCLRSRAARRFQYEDSGPRMLLLSLEESASGTNLTASWHQYDSSIHVHVGCRMWRHQGCQPRAHRSSDGGNWWCSKAIKHDSNRVHSFSPPRHSLKRRLWPSRCRHLHVLCHSPIRARTLVGFCLLRLLDACVALANRRSYPPKTIV